MDDREKATLEREKLVAEIRKLDADNSIFNRLFTTILSLSAVLIAGSQIWMAHLQGVEQKNQADRDQQLKAIELHIRQVESGLKLSQFAIDERSLFLASSADEQVRAVRLVEAMLPEEEARRMLEAIGKIATQAEVLSAVETSKHELGKSGSGQPTAEPAPPQAASRPVPSAVSPPTAAPTAAVPTVAAPPTVAPAPAAIATKLVVYYHVQRPDDRDLANAVAGSLPQQFPSAGVQLILQGPKVAQVRYYKPEQRNQAIILSQQLAASVKALTGTDVTFQPSDISKMFPNLPSDRVEVWFAPSMPSLRF